MMCGWVQILYNKQLTVARSWAAPARAAGKGMPFQASITACPTPSPVPTSHAGQDAYQGGSHSLGLCGGRGRRIHRVHTEWRWNPEGKSALSAVATLYVMENRVKGSGQWACSECTPHPHQTGLIFSIVMECTPEIGNRCVLCGRIPLPLFTHFYRGLKIECFLMTRIVGYYPLGYYFHVFFSQDIYGLVWNWTLLLICTQRPHWAF